MSELVDGVSDASIEGSAGDDKQTVAYDTYAKVLSQRKADQAKLQEANARLAEIDSQNKVDAETALKEQNKWQEIAEAKEAELLTTRGQLDGVTSSIVRADKVHAFEELFGAQLKHRDFMSHIDTDAIALTESGEVDKESLEAEVNRFRASYGDSLTINKEIASLPGGAARKPDPITVGTMSKEQRAAARTTLLAK